jgi:hypothetical protein
MKVANQTFLPEIALFLFCLLVISCKKADISNSRQTSNTSIQSPTTFAGSDQVLQLPLDFFSLDGSYSAPNQIDKVHWQKLSGPYCIIESQNALSTKVSGIQAGIYQFELTVFNKSNFSGKDTVMITVNRQPDNITIGPNFCIISSLPWIFPWYNSLEVENIYSYIQQGRPLRVFVQRGSSTDWIVAHPISHTSNSNTYEYFIETRPEGAGMYNFGSLYVFYYGSDINDRPNVKVEF